MTRMVADRPEQRAVLVPMTPADLWDHLIAFDDEFFPKWRRMPIVYDTNALAGEAGETLSALLSFLETVGKICNVAKKYEWQGGTSKRGSHEELWDHLWEEIADAETYLRLLVARLGGHHETLDRVVEQKYTINVARMTATDGDTPVFAAPLPPPEPGRKGSVDGPP